MLELLCQAILNRQTIAFQYTRPGKVLGVRIGNTHVVFILPRKDGQKPTYALIWQIDGVSDVGEPMPGWRQFFLDALHDVELLDTEPFAVAADYKPHHYQFPIARI